MDDRADCTQLKVSEINENNYRVFLQGNYDKIVSMMSPDNFVLISLLISKFVLNDEDRQIIQSSGLTSQSKVGTLVDIISTKGVRACKIFVTALEFNYPDLYEKLTGEKADVPRHAVFFDVEKELLAKRHERLTKELHETVYLLQKALKEKRECESETMRLNSDLKYQIACRKNLEEQLRVKEKKSDNGEHAVADRARCLIERSELHREIERQNMTIAQFERNLSYTTEELDKVRKNREVIKKENEELSDKIRDLSERYNRERTNSHFLNQRVTSQSHQLNETASVQRELSSVKYKLKQVIEEKDQVIQDFEAFRKCTELLNSRFHLVHFEKEEVAELRDKLSQNYIRLCDTVFLLETKVHDLETRNAFYEQNSNRLKDEINLRNEEKQMILIKLDTIEKERDNYFLDREKLMEEIKMMQVNRDCERQELLTIHEQVKERLATATESLEVKDKEGLELKKQLADANSEIENCKRKYSSLLQVTGQEPQGEETEPRVSDRDNHTLESNTLPDSNSDLFRDVRWIKVRPTKDLLQSIHRNLASSEDSNKTKSLAAMARRQFYREKVLHIRGSDSDESSSSISNMMSGDRSSISSGEDHDQVQDPQTEEDRPHQVNSEELDNDSRTLSSHQPYRGRASALLRERYPSHSDYRSQGGAEQLNGEGQQSA